MNELNVSLQCINALLDDKKKKGLRKGMSVKWFKHVVTLNQWLKL